MISTCWHLQLSLGHQALHKLEFAVSSFAKYCFLIPYTHTQVGWLIQLNLSYKARQRTFQSPKCLLKVSALSWVWASSTTKSKRRSLRDIFQNVNFAWHRCYLVMPEQLVFIHFNEKDLRPQYRTCPALECGAICLQGAGAFVAFA